MRRLIRPAASLPTLTRGNGARAAAKNIRLREANPRAPLSFPSHWTAKDVRGALLAMHGRSCAYCQGDLRHNDLGDVEHFRPKSVYWWLAYDFSNFLLSCIACNRTCKSDKFPLLEGISPCSYEKRDHLDQEKTALLDPVHDDIESWLQVDWADPLCRVKPADHLGAGSEARKRAQQTIDFFQLKEHPFIRKERREIINAASELLDEIRAGSSSKLAKLQDMANRYRPYGLAVRQMLLEVAPDLLLSPEQELRQLVRDFLDLLSEIDGYLSLEDPDSALNLHHREEALWALAVLWKYPPVGSPDLIEDSLTNSGWRDEIAALKEEI